MHFTGTKIFALGSAIVKVQEMFSSHGSILLSWRNTIIKLTHYVETKKGLTTHSYQILRFSLENLKLSHVGPATDKHQAPTRRLKSAVANVTIRSTKYTQQSAPKGIYSHLLVSKGKGR